MSDAGTNGTRTARLSAEGADMLTLAGVNDANLLELSRLCGVRVTLRGDTLSISGPRDLVDRAVEIVDTPLQGDGELDEIRLVAAEQDLLGGACPPEPDPCGGGEKDGQQRAGDGGDRDPERDVGAHATAG